MGLPGAPAFFMLRCFQNLCAKIVYKYVADAPWQFGKHRLLKLSSPVISGSVVQSKYGPRLRANPADSTNTYAIVGGYGQLISNHLKQLQPGDCFIDIGANLGLFSILAAERVKETGLVLAFEPSPREYSWLLANKAENDTKSLMAFNVAIGDGFAWCNLATGTGCHSGSNSISPTGDARILAMHLNAPDWTELIRPIGAVMIKIDTEGYEHSVLRGLVEILKMNSIHSVIVEIDDGNLQTHGTSTQAIYEFMSELGYRGTQERSAHYDEVFVR